MNTIFFSLKVNWRIKCNETVVPVHRFRLELFFSNWIGCCNYRRGEKSPDDKVTRSMQARKYDQGGPAWQGICSFDFSPAWIWMQFYDHSYNRCETLARVKAKREGACATSFTVVTRVIVHAKRSASKIRTS